MKPTNQVLVDQLAAVEEQLAQRDARIAELERRDTERMVTIAGYQDRAMRAEEQLAALNAAPAQAAERVTVYVIMRKDGTMYGLYAPDERKGVALRLGDRWLALDARAVQEGGA